MKKIIASLMVAALAFTACSPKEQFAIDSQKPAEDGFYASISSETRTYLEEDGDIFHVYWKSGDKIRCTDDGENSNVIYQTFDNGVKSAWFTHFPEDTTFLCVDSTKFWAYYPSTLRGKRLPAIQQYAPNSLAAAPMRGYYERGELDEFKPSFKFTQLCGAVKLNLTTTQSDVKVRSIVIKADWGLSGSYSATNDEPAAVMSSETSPVTLECPDVPIGSEPVPFFISIPQHQYYSFAITVITDDGRTQTRNLKSGQSLTVTRAEIIPIDLNFDNLQKPTSGETALFMKGSDMNYTIKGVINPDVSNWTDDDTTVTRMVFLTESDEFSAVNIAAAESESPIYVIYDEDNTTIKITTPAKKFILNPNSIYFFHRFRALTEIEGIDDFDTSLCESMSYFWGYSPLKTITMPKWDYSSLINTRYMFCGVEAEKIDLSNMDFSNDTTLAYFFYLAADLQEIVWPEVLNVENVESMTRMYRGTSFTEVDLTMFEDTDNLKTMNYMFADCPNLHKVKANLTLDNVTSATYMFYNSCENSPVLDLTEFGDVSTLQQINSMFRSCKCSTLNISTWDTSSSKNFSYTFYKMPNLTNLYLGNDFGKDGNPPTNTAMWAGTADKPSSASYGDKTAIIPGVLNIYTSSDQMDWLVNILTLRYLRSGYYDDSPVTIRFFDFNTGVEMFPAWPE
ncbi:MAG: BspA family leucine-rich repeat surface protein [Bacteroidales bacterium]|nr:BspA family leucine-rich repeat surface protein [Bacteroidales bacterium]